MVDIILPPKEISNYNLTEFMHLKELIHAVLSAHACLSVLALHPCHN